MRTKPTIKGHIERRFRPIVLDRPSIYSSIHPLLSVCQGENLGTKLGNFDAWRERNFFFYNILPNEFLSCVVVVGVVLFTLELIIVKFRV